MRQSSRQFVGVIAAALFDVLLYDRSSGVVVVRSRTRGMRARRNGKPNRTPNGGIELTCTSAAGRDGSLIVTGDSREKSRSGRCACAAG